MGQPGRVGQALSMGQAGRVGRAISMCQPGRVGQAGSMGHAISMGQAGCVGQAISMGQAGCVGQAGRVGRAYHLRDAAVGEDVARVDEAVEHFGRLLDQIALVRVVLQLLVCAGHTKH